MLTRRNGKLSRGGVLSLSLWILILHMMAPPLSAQSFSADARKIGMGALGGGSAAAQLVEDARSYRSIVIPFGAFQLLGNLDIFNPDSPQFDPVRVMEYAINPLHFTAAREAGGRSADLVTDIVNGNLNRDLNTYRGFVPASQLNAEGLLFFTFGKTVKLVEGENGFQGFYIGAGPYLPVDTAFNIDQDLIDILSSDVDVFRPGETFDIRTLFSQQFALATTFGYRGRVGLPGSSNQSDRDGLYLAVDYHYLYGIRHDDITFDLRFDTEPVGNPLIFPNPGFVTLAPTTTPLQFDRFASTSGRGFAIDVAVTGVSDRWEAGVDISGIANRITWKDFYGERVVLPSLTQALQGGFSFITTPLLTPPSQFPAREGRTCVGGECEIKLPVNYGGNLAYSGPVWGAAGQLTRGFQGTSFRAGLERRFGIIELRGGTWFSRDRWHPTGGIGLNVLGAVSFDVAVFSTSTNVELARKLALAVSLRIN